MKVSLLNLKAAWIRYGDLPPAEQMAIIESCDTRPGLARKNDRSVGTTCGIKEKNLLLARVHVGRWELPELARQVVERAIFYKASAVLIEDANSGAGLINFCVHRT